MEEGETTILELFEQAKAGDRDALGQLLDHLRPDLCRMAQASIDSKIRVRAAASDIAQHSCLSAVRDFNRFQGEQLEEFLAWLRQIHAQNLRDAFRDHGVRKKRAVSREVELVDQLHAIDARLATPSHEIVRKERRAKIAEMLETLPEGQREAVRLRHLEGLSLTEIAKHLDRTEAAVAGLLKRGLAKLRETMKGDGEGQPYEPI